MKLENMISGSYLVSTGAGMIIGQGARDQFGKPGDILYDSMSMYFLTACSSFLFLNLVNKNRLGRALAVTVPPAVMTIYEFASKLDNKILFFYDEKDIIAYWAGSLTSLLVSYVVQRNSE